MLQKSLFLLFLAISTVSCQFTEIMNINEDGTGRMSLSVDLSEMMAFGGEFSKDSTAVKTDTIISFKDILEEKKDSISKLSEEEQMRLKAMENYKIHMLTDPETNKMILDVFTDFEDVSEANDLMKGFKESEGLIPGASNNNQSEEDDGEEEPELVGVSFSYNKGVFKRDAYIKDKEAHKKQIDSMKQAEAFMGGMIYKLKYTFPKKIKKSSVKDATFSLDGKTIELQRTFLEYMKDPDVLDLEIELEN